VAKRSTTAGERAFSFGPFRFLPAQQLLLDGEAPVRLGSRALGILSALIERSGELVSKGDLIAHVWPDTTVEENNLKVHIVALRRALGDGQAGRRYVATVPGRGYSFVAPVERSAPVTPSWDATAERAHNLPASSTRTVGRADTIDALLTQLRQHRFVSVVGPGGIGKTTVALAAAESLISAYEHGIWFVDLAPVRDPHVVLGTLASAIGVTMRSPNAADSLMAYLRNRQMLILLDSCEYVIDAAASMAEQIISGAAGAHILATCREPLGARGERVHRLGSLETPSKPTGLTAAEALAFPAVQLFVERARASLEDFELGDADAPVVADICGKLDGVPLAIELAAARIDAFGIRELSGLLDDQFRLLKQGSRTAVLRHRSLAAALDWSYELLTADERLILCRLSVFSGPFALEAAVAVAGHSGMAARDVIDGVANLVAKSLVLADVSGPSVQYRLLDTTRAYALQKLGEKDAEAVVKRHAEHHRDLFVQAALETETHPAADWLVQYGRKIDDVRAALNWAFSGNGDSATGVALTIAALPLWTRLSLMDECRAWVERALASDTPDARLGDRDQMKLYAALGPALLLTRGPRPEVAAAWTRTLQIAERLNDSAHRLRALWGLSTYHRAHGDYRAAVSFGEICFTAAGEGGDARAQLASERLIAAALHYLGDYGKARRLSERFLSHYTHPAQPTHNARFPYDQRTGALGTLANILWLQGFPDQAVQAAQKTLEEAHAKMNGLVLCDVILHAPMPMALHVGDWQTAERLMAIVRENLTNHALSYGRAQCFENVLHIQRGDISKLPRLRQAIEELREAEFGMRFPAYLGELAQGLGAGGQATEARAVIEEALDMCERSEEHWCLPELLRIKGDLLQSEDHYRQALATARQQGALSWELRAATSLARLWQLQGKAADAYDLLSAVYGRFTEGFETIDLTSARALMENLRGILGRS
jgi:predicted ATPase/DNA-binding winged helix-turn-helix (wHTH) protein